MRDIDTWRKAIEKELVALAKVHDGFTMGSTDFVEVELILGLLHDHLPGESVEEAWSVLNGHAFPAKERLPRAAQRAIRTCRLCLRQPLGRGAWQRKLERYLKLKAPYPLFQVTSKGVGINPNALLATERLVTYRQTLSSPPPLQRNTLLHAQEGIHRFYLDGTAHEIRIPAEFATFARHRVRSPLRTSPPAARTPLKVSLKKLLATARWMERQAPQGSAADRPWATLMEDIEIRLVTEAGLQPSDTLMVDGLLNLLGMVGSGKTTLLTVLAVHTARRGAGQRVVLVQSDVASLLHAQSVFTALGINAVPLIGRSTRVTHLNRLHATEFQAGTPSLTSTHPGHEMLATVCALDGLRRDVKPIPAGQEPCFQLYTTDDKRPQRRACPLVAVCPVHTPLRRLADAPIWLATPASLLASGPYAPLVMEEVRYAELVMRSADLILVDEADLAQVQFDDKFAPMETLVGRTDSFLDRLAVQVTRQINVSGRPTVGRIAALEGWRTAHENTQSAVNRLLRHLRDTGLTRQWLSNTYFSGQRLLQRVGGELRREGVLVSNFNDMLLAFVRQPFNAQSGSISAWHEALHAEFLNNDSATALQVLASWIDSQKNGLSPETRDHLAGHLLVALDVAVLDHALNQVIATWSDVTDFIDLDRGSGGLFHAPPQDLVQLIPEAPMGNVLGFQYYDPEDNGSGDLRFFRVYGVGRDLLYHLHDALLDSDGIAGPHVILTSGTSWAPGSWRYHLQVRPDVVLLPNRKEREATNQTKMIFDFVTDPSRPDRPLVVSGVSGPERLYALRSMVTELARPRGYTNESMLDLEMAVLPPHRQRILLVVGSYDEARVVGEALNQALGRPVGQEVQIMVPDASGEPGTQLPEGHLLRSMLAKFPTLPARFLVAPLAAIERGHNILVGQEAAIGSVYFLVRPVPPPGDAHTAIQSLNAWSTKYVADLQTENVALAGTTLREAARDKWDTALHRRETYKEASDRYGLLWTQLVLVVQTVGRLLRGGVPARVHFVDAKWGEVSSELVEGVSDTATTSMLVGFREILREQLEGDDCASRVVAEALYGAFAAALNNVENLRS